MNPEFTTETLTAYVLGELDDAERAAIEEALEHDETVQAVVAELRETANFARTALQPESAPSLTDDQRKAVLDRAELPAKPRSRRLRQLVWAVGAAAAVLLVTLALSPALQSQVATLAMLPAKDVSARSAPPANDPARITLAQGGVVNENDGGGQPELEPAQEISPAETLFREGVTFYNDDKYREALNSFNRALVLDPALEKADRMRQKCEGRIVGPAGGLDPVAIRNLPTVAPSDLDEQVETGEFQLASEEVKLKRTKELILEGQFLLENQRYQRAVDALNQALILAPHNRTARRLLAEAAIGASKERLEPIPEQPDKDARPMLAKATIDASKERLELVQEKLDIQRQDIRESIYTSKMLPEGADSGGYESYAFGRLRGGGSVSDRLSVSHGWSEPNTNTNLAWKGSLANPEDVNTWAWQDNLARNGRISQADLRDMALTYDTDTFGEIDALRHLGYFADPRKVHAPGHMTEAYDRIVENAFLEAVSNPLSTFSIDVDTASYANVRRFLNQNSLPMKGAVRIEELVNYFSYDYAPPDGEDPFSAHVEVAGCPWKPKHRLARIGLKGWELDAAQRPATNLVFLVDVSGSMRPENKLPLLRRSMKMLARQMNENDQIAIAVYAGASGLVLPTTNGEDKQAILGALNRLEAGGSTNGGAGIQLAYDTAVGSFIKGGVNRVILATDGDFNVGVTNQSELVRLIENKAKTGVFLTVLGFGMGNLKDSNLEKLADKGNGNYAYIDTAKEARKVLVEEMSGTLVTIAKDVKIQVEFNPARVNAYRLIGYENRILAAEDFNDDTKDAGEIGAGHTVTALYEIVPAGVGFDVPGVDPLKYQRPTAPSDAASSEELFTLKLRYKKPDGDTSKLLAFPITDGGSTLEDASPDFKFAASVAGFGMLLRESEHKGDASFNSVRKLAQQGLGEDGFGYRAEFVKLVQKAKRLRKQESTE